jgi:hypothetical protein
VASEGDAIVATVENGNGVAVIVDANLVGYGVEIVDPATDTRGLEARRAGGAE